MKSVRWIVSYIFVAVIGLWMAFAVSMKFIAPAHSQGAPDSGELPAEFMQEVDATQVPPPPASEVPPPPTNQMPASNMPVENQVPSAAESFGENVTAPQASFVSNDEYFYDPTGKRDPFKPYKAVSISSGPIKDVVLEPLQRFDLDKLQIVGILWDVRSPRAMIKDPDGAVHTIIKNTKMGRSEGFVAAIREGEIVVVETRYEEGKPIKDPRIIEFKK